MNRRLWSIPAVIFAVALLYRLLYVLPIHAPLTSDMKGYADSARNLLAGRGLVMSEEYRAYRPPLYPLFLAGCFEVFGERYTPVRVIQALVGAGAAALVFFITLRLLDPAKASAPRSVREALGNGPWLAAALAGLSAAVFDALIFYTGEFLTETWYVFLLVALIYRLLAGSAGTGGARGADSGRAVVNGALLGLMALLRPVALVLYPAMVFVEREKGTTLKGLRLMVVATAIVIVPWTIRNAVVLGAFVPISTNTGVNLYIGHNPYFGYWSTGDKEGIRQSTDLDEVEESRYFTRLAADFGWTHPWVTLRNTAAKFYYLYRLPRTPEFLARTEDDRVRSYKPWPWPGNGAPLRFAGVEWLPMVAWGTPFLAVLLIGLGFSWPRRRKFELLYLIVICHTLAHLVFFGQTRFAVPMMPIFCILAAYGVARVLAWAGMVRFSKDETG